MQSRKHEDFLIQSPAAKLRDRRLELGRDPCAMPRRDVLERSPRSRRSLSPRKLRPPLGGDRRSSSLERRDYGWDLSGVRGDRVRSRSPLFGQVHKRPHYDEGISGRDMPPTKMGRGNEFFEHMDANADVNTGLKHEYGYKHYTSRVMDFDGSRLSDAGGHGMLGQNSMVLEDGTARGSMPTSKYVEGGNFSSSLANLDLGQFKNERIRYPDPLLLDKQSAMESYGKEEKPKFHSRDIYYPVLPASQSKDFISTSQFKDFAITSSGISRANFSGSYRDGMPSPTDEFPRSSRKLTDPLGFSGYGQKPILDPGRHSEAEHKDLRDTFSPTRAECRDYLYPRRGGRESDDYGYPSDDLYRMGFRDRRDFLRPSMMDLVAEHHDNIECSHRNMRESSLWDHPSMQKQTVPNYIGMSRSSTASKQGGEYLDSGSARVEFGRRVLREQEISHLGVSQEHEISHLRSDYGFGRDAGPASLKDRMRNSPEFKYEAEVHRLAVRTQGLKAEELGVYDLSNRQLKRKYSVDEEMSGHISRRTMSSKWNNSSRTKDLDDRGKEWIGHDASGSFSSRGAGYDQNLYRRADRTYNGADHHRVSASEDWLSSHDTVEHVQEHSTKAYKPSGRYLKGHSRPSSLSLYNSYRFNKKHVLPKPRNVWIRGRDDNQVDMYSNEVDQLEDWVSSAKSEPPEGSEEFKQLVHKAFLLFTKQLNAKAVRKRYKEQGRAGYLFCIVCGRSLSKEFMDTQRLAMHAFMSHKVGLRAQHLGLHKAICVLLGWNSEVAPDVITWVPEAISSAEALAQKEDLLLWPPVIVIHNSSISDNDSEEQKVITVEALGDFLRGKGFGGGKVKVCLGKPANHSILVVKFLGTFSGLQHAERLHNYFAENKRGRTDFEQMASSKGKSSDNGEGGMQRHNAEELVLYGYMGIAEDLDKVDFDFKRKCTINSKKEIQDLANAPVKPE